jgi:hypothetical protein
VQPFSRGAISIAENAERAEKYRQISTQDQAERARRYLNLSTLRVKNGYNKNGYQVNRYIVVQLDCVSHVENVRSA